jgi:hypothetical protein
MPLRTRVILRHVSSPDDTASSAYLEHTRDLAGQLLRANDPYEVGLRLWSYSMGVTDPGEYAGGICALWGALTDWVELKPHEEALAKEHMVKAAREWLALDPHDSVAIRRYFAHWLDDVMGNGQP